MDGKDSEETKLDVDGDAAEHHEPDPPHVDHGELKEGLICVPLDTRKQIKLLVSHIVTQVLVTILVLLDAIFSFISVANSENDGAVEEEVNIASIIILVFLTIEVVLRLIYMDFKPFFSSPLAVFDFVVVFVCLIIELAITDRQTKDLVSLLVVLRVFRVMRVCANFYRTRKHVAKTAQGAVSGHRRRYQKGEFDLDITYITDSLLAMSVPAVGLEKNYRNPLEEVVDFFESKHPDNYRFYNCCPERNYPYEKFHNRVYEWFMDDHNPCPIHEIIEFCHHIHEYIRSDDPKNEKQVAAVHCKGGKGRTGTLVCSYLVYAGIETKEGKITTAMQAMNYFAARRTDDVNETVGVEARSQSRYIRYIARLMQELSDQNKPISALTPPKGPIRKIVKIRVKGISLISRDFGTPTFEVTNGKYCQPRFPMYKGTVKDCQTNPNLHNGEEKYDYLDYIPSAPIEVQDDVKVSFYIESKKDDFFGYWWHTYFEEGEEVKEDNPDGDIRVLKFDYMFVDGIRWAIKKKKYKTSFPKYFECQTFFQVVET